MHLGAIGLTYATNWRRSALQDRVLVWLQPYLIGVNWYQEMLPIEWISDSNSTKKVRVSIQTASIPNEWQTVLDSSRNSPTRTRSERFMYPLVELARSEDGQGITNMLASIVLHLEGEKTNDSETILRIRLENVSMAASGSDTESVLYEASLARFPSSEFGFVPEIEKHRSVPAIESTRNSP